MASSPRAFLVQQWRDQTPEGYLFTAKVPGQITHKAKLATADAHGRPWARLGPARAVSGPGQQRV